MSTFFTSLMQQYQAQVEQEKQAAVQEAEASADLFDGVFYDHTAKLAALDPEYAAHLESEHQKAAAFQAGFDAVIAQAQQFGVQ
jgi:hypothetical protein